MIFQHGLECYELPQWPRAIRNYVNVSNCVIHHWIGPDRNLGHHKLKLVDQNQLFTFIYEELYNFSLAVLLWSAQSSAIVTNLAIRLRSGPIRNNGSLQLSSFFN